jgi:hypothetical protein
MKYNEKGADNKDLAKPWAQIHTQSSENEVDADNVNSPHMSAPPAIDFPQTIIAPHPNAFSSSTDYPESLQHYPVIFTG